jgi:hypothetical protein
MVEKEYTVVCLLSSPAGHPRQLRCGHRQQTITIHVSPSRFYCRLWQREKLRNHVSNIQRERNVGQQKGTLSVHRSIAVDYSAHIEFNNGVCNKLRTQARNCFSPRL